MAPPPPPLTEGTFAKANRLKEAAFAGRLKEATRDLGAAHIDSLRTVFAARVLQTRERLNRLTCSARVESLESTYQHLGLNHVRALGLGLLERTEAVLDLLLQLADAEHQHNQLSDEACDADDREEASWRQRIPRALPIQVLQTFAVSLSESRSVRVSVIGMQDTCNCLAQRLKVYELWELLRSVHSWAEEKQKQLTDEQGSTGTPRVAERAVQIARVGCEKLLPSRVGRFLDGLILVRLLGQRDSEGEEEHSSPDLGTSVFVEEIVEEEGGASSSGGRTFLAELGDLGELQSRTGRGLRLVVRNSFIELVEEPSPREKRRARSCEPVLLAYLGDSSDLDASAPTHPGPSPAEGSQSSRSFPETNPGLLPAEGSQSSRSFPETLPGPLPAEGSQSSRSFPETNPGLLPAEGSQRSRYFHETLPGPLPAEGTVHDDSTTACILADHSECLTVMLRNVPPSFARFDLLVLLNEIGFSGRYDFVYLPVDFTRNLGLGYALVGLVDHTSARALMQHLQGLSFPSAEGNCFQCEASWSEPHRGLEGHIERYRNSPVMHHSMPDEYKPAIFVNGERVPFPPPTKAIRAPRIRHPKAEGKAVVQRSSAS
eukprot:TRINITY_DN4889_c0_g1_i1.p1 TRINITY_DN4889_c0_g1~~TRINITY_DN4889_c0_g1_i1.p1  ORF type:complete len:617 (+),score=102.52 TRINITY_DN4889_c0_g1_i1:46-1851(+)